MAPAARNEPLALVARRESLVQAAPAAGKEPLAQVASAVSEKLRT